MACCPGSMTAMFINIIPEFRHDQAVQRLMVASTSSILSAVVDILMLGISLEDISVPPAAAEYARRFAQHDLSLEALLRATTRPNVSAGRNARMPPTSRRCGRCWLPRGSQRPWPSRCWACRCAGGISRRLPGSAPAMRRCTCTR